MTRRALALAWPLLALCGCPPADFLGTAQPDADAGSADAGSDAPASDAGPARSCDPEPPAAIASRYAPPRPVHANACDEAARASLAACFATQKPSKCDALLAAMTETCRACAVSPSTEAAWGAVVRYAGGAYVPNQAGCWAASLPEDGGIGCAPAIQRRAECQILGVCGQCTDPLPRELNACFKAATLADGACSGAQAEEQACTFPIAGQPAGRAVFDLCIQTNGEMPQAYWRRLLDFFCGP